MQHRSLRTLLAGLALMTVTISAIASTRWFPVEAKRGVASFTSYPKIVIDGKEYRAAPGLRIWNKSNMLKFQRALKDENVTVNYTMDSYKMVDRIWILTPAEAAKPLKQNPNLSATTNE